MQYNGLVWGCVLLSLLLLGLSGRLLVERSWLLGWLRGTAGMLGILAALCLSMLAYDLYSYKPLPETGEPLLEISFRADGTQRYLVTLTEGERVRTIPLTGDLWQLDVRVLRWKGLAALIGLEPGCRLDQLTGRFLSAEQEAGADGNRVLLSRSPAGLDLWRWLRDNRRDFGMFDAWGGRISFQPMADRAKYEVRLTAAGLMIEPVNDSAREAGKG